MELMNKDTTRDDVPSATTPSTEFGASAKEELLPMVGRCGLMNNGNTCYLNTGIQVSVEYGLNHYIVFVPYS